MRVFPDTLVNMVNWMKENKQAWAAGCNLVEENGGTIKHVRRFPKVWDQLAIILKLPHVFPAVLNNYLRTDFNYTEPTVVNSIRGGFFMVRQETIKKIGMLDEQFFLWFEEVDYCQRIKKIGGEVWYTPEAKCVDYIGQSFKQVKRGVAQKYFRDSMLKYFKKWHPAWQYWLLKITWLFGIVLALIGEKFNIITKAKT
jgi:GT2 family glycosyltransferase